MEDKAQQPDSVAALLHRVGRRPAPPQEDRARVFAASREAWQRSVRQRRWRRWSYSLAAGVVVALLIGVSWRLGPSAQVEAARLSIVQGGVFAGDTAGSEWHWINRGGVPMLAGARLRTDPTGRAVLKLAGESSLRVAGSTDLLLQPANRIELLAGRVYIDTQQRGGGSVEVVTRFGTLRDIGTQFEVLATRDGLRLRTREGAVSLTRDGSGQRIECASSEELRMDASGRLERGRIEQHDDEWSWGEALSEPPRGDPLPLTRLLDWVARETGRRLEYDSTETRARVRSVVLHGSTSGLPPVKALEVALATTDIDYTLLDDGTILLRRRQRQ